MTIGEFIAELIFAAYVRYRFIAGDMRCICRTPADESICPRYH